MSELPVCPESMLVLLQERRSRCDTQVGWDMLGTVVFNADRSVASCAELLALGIAILSAKESPSSLSLASSWSRRPLMVFPKVFSALAVRQPGTHEEPTTHSQRGGRASLVQVRLTTPREGPVARYWQALVAGPEGTPYEEGLFRLVLVFKEPSGPTPRDLCRVCGKIWDFKKSQSGLLWGCQKSKPGVKTDSTPFG